MSRRRSEKRDQAYEIWEKSGRKMKLVDIAKRLEVSASQIRKWKHLDKWDDKPRRKRGGQPGNKNAIGNEGGGAPPGNKNAWKHGMYESLWMSEIAVDHKMKLMHLEANPREILLNEIRLLELRQYNMMKYTNDIHNEWDSESTEDRWEFYEEEIGEKPTFEDNNLKMEPVIVDREKLVERKIKKPQKLERLLAIENQLSTIQGRKLRAITLLDQFDRNELTEDELKLRINRMQLEVDKLKSEAW